MGEAGGGLPGNLPTKTLHGGAGETSPPAFAASYLRSFSRSLFVFCFEGDPHGLSRAFQKAKLLPSTNSMQRQERCSAHKDLGSLSDREAGLLSPLQRFFKHGPSDVNRGLGQQEFALGFEKEL